jgi:hypothetical protein
MDRSKRVVVVLSLALLVVLALVSVGTPAVAVVSHKHCMETPAGWVEVGPRVFLQPHLHDTGFHEFHDNVHASAVPTNIRAILDAAVECSSFNTP